MAGGAEPDEEYCSDDELGPVDTAALRKRFNIEPEDSSSTLYTHSDEVSPLNHVATTKELLQLYYNNLKSDNLPKKREKSRWTSENDYGLLLGLIAFGSANHITQLHDLLLHNQFHDQKQSFIDSMFD